MKTPSEVGGELLCFRTRQEHAELQRLQELDLADPSPFLNHFRLEDGDLPGGAPETHTPDLEPKTRGFAEGRLDLISTFHGDGFWRNSTEER
jgi:hypothetical protein